MIFLNNKKWKNVILFSALGFSIIFLIEISPRIYNVAVISVDLLAKKIKSDSNQKIKENVNVLIMRNKNITRQIGAIVSDYNKNRNISDVVNLLDSLSLYCKIHITDIKPQQIIKNNNLWVQPIDVTMSSNYESIYNLINAIEHSTKVILLKKIFITNNNNLNKELTIKAHFEVYLNI